MSVDIFDEVSGVLTRSATMNNIRQFLSDEGKFGTHALVMLDIDNFKTINDTLGHIGGDNAINKIGQSLLSQFRKEDIVGRVGGDEFFVFIKDIKLDKVGLKRKISEVLSSLQIVVSNNDKYVVTSVSAGIAIYDGSVKEPKSLNNLYSEADIGLYRAKEAGKNTCAFADQNISDDFSNIEIMSDDANIFDFRTVLNSLGTGIVIFKGNGNDLYHWTPVFCNEGYLKISGISYNQLKDRLCYENRYTIHPDDVDLAMQKFVDAYNTRNAFEHTIRIEIDNNIYRWIRVFANIRYGDNNDFYVYMVYTDADKQMKEREIEIKRYNDFLDLIEQSSKDSLFTARMNLTKNHYETYFRYPHLNKNLPSRDSIEEFDEYASSRVAYEDYRQEFKKLFYKDRLIEAFSSGRFHTSMKLPIRLDDNRVIWCRNIADVSSNPDTGDIEGIMRLIEDDIRIRIDDHFHQMLHADYEIVADINTETGYLTIISQTKDRDIENEIFDNTHYMSNLRDRLKKLVDPRFVDDCYKAMNIDTVKEKLKEVEIYTCTFPANKDLLGHDGVFQWRFGYVGNGKDIMFARREMMSFLDKKHRDQSESLHSETKNLLIKGANHSLICSRNGILIADDVDINREMLKIIFEDDFNIIEAEDGEKAIQLIDENYDNLALILLDYMMPKKTGLDVLLHMKLRNLNEKIPVIMVTGTSTKDINLQSFEYGISDIINKPFDARIVRRRSLNLIEQYAHKEDIERQMNRWKKEAIQLHNKSEKYNQMLINTLSSVVGTRSLESGLHINRVRELTKILLKTWTILFPENNFDDDTIQQISMAATLHDIGKVAIPDNILMKPGRLTSEEFEIMKKHTVLGCQMLDNLKEEDGQFYRYCYDICRHHHERNDGRGYPDGLVGEEIPIWAQIVSIVDVFDALISPRVYKEALPYDKAIDMIVSGECGVFSKKLLRCFDIAKTQIISKSIEMAQSEKEGD